MSNKKLIVVLGMHRSGTSVITRGLQVMGVELGENLITAIEGNNPKGFWEDVDVNTLNNEMLESIGSDWRSVSAITQKEVDALRNHDYHYRAAALLQQKIEDVPIFGLKDPRIAKLLPFWKKVFSHCGLDVSYILAVRNPLSVAKSLAERDGIEAEQSYLLWLGHVVISLLHSSDDERIVVDYDRLMQSPSHELNRIANSISLEIDPVELESYETVFLDEGLRHTVYTINDLSLDATCPPIVREVYAALLDVASDKVNLNDAGLQHKIVHWSGEFERLRSPLIFIDRILAKKLVDMNEIEKRDAEIARLDLALVERREQIDHLNKAVSERNGHISSLNQSLAERDILYQEIACSRSWKMTAPLRILGVQVRRVLGIRNSRSFVMDSAVGIKSAAGKAIRIYKNEGLAGVRRVLSEKCRCMHTRQTYSNAELRELAGEDLTIPRIDFDQTRNRFVEYKNNSPIDPTVKLIAFYLPQFHPFQENDNWWGKGFTEWTNVGKALPNYVGHYQPHCPIHFGYYDLRIPEVMEEQAKLAREYGIHGFSYYFYWFSGKILMNAPLEGMLANKKVDIPFCMTWANENWSRRWDGRENDILIAQNHNDEDSLAFIRHLIKYFKDDRYIRIQGKPVLIIYRANIIPNMASIAKLWRDEVLRHDIPGLYLIAAQSFGIRSPEEFDFDASVEFPPHTVKSGSVAKEIKVTNKDYTGNIYSYEQVAANAVVARDPNYKLYRTAMLSWDNTARKQNNSHIFHDFSLLRYKQWLSSIVNKVHSNPKYTVDEKIVFVNAWNEWAEGTHLEPDQKYGYGYLQTTYDVLKEYDSPTLSKLSRAHASVKNNERAVILHLHYNELWPNIREYLIRSINNCGFDLYVSVTSASVAKKVLEDFPGAYVELVENRGRDILAFIRMLKVIDGLDYTAVCKIHSKRSIYRDDGDDMRDEMFDSLMGSVSHVKEIINRFRNNEHLGMVAPEKYLIKHNKHNMTFDKEVVRRVAKHLNINFKYGIFPAGSMFWFSPKSLKPLLNIDDSFFDIESGLADGTCAHAIERLFCQIVLNCGYTIESC